MADDKFQLTGVRFIKRVVVGSHDPSNPRSNDEIEGQMAYVNKCMSEYPHGVIIGIERNFQILQIFDNHVISQYTVYHLGFPRRPPWMDQK